jgi:hypothetical protein
MPQDGAVFAGHGWRTQGHAEPVVPLCFFALNERQEALKRCRGGKEEARRRYREGTEEESGGQEAGTKRAQKEREKGTREGKEEREQKNWRDAVETRGYTRRGSPESGLENANISSIEENSHAERF